MTNRCYVYVLVALSLVIGSSRPGVGQQTTLERPQQTRQQDQRSHTATSQKNMVASVHPMATQAGLEAFANGGNAVDAAIATALTLGVVDNYNSGIGGGCFILIRTANGEFFAIDGREMAPAAAHKDMFRDTKSSVVNPSQTGALASGVPGALMAYGEAVQRHGRLKFSDALRCGKEAAANGFAVTKAYARSLRTAQKPMSQFPSTVEIFFRTQSGGRPEPYKFGETFKQADLAATYQSIADEGIGWFYQGEFATATEEWMQQNGGIMSAEDLANYKIVDRQPIQTTYRGYQIVGFPPPSSGGVHVAQVLNILEAFDLKQLYSEDPAKMYHVVAEAMKLAFADRAHWLGDPDFVDVPVGLVDKRYGAELAGLIDMETAMTTRHGVPPDANAKFFERHTTHIAAADIEGNWVGLTTTVNTTFGAKYVIPGTGVIMNNQMDDFVAVPGKPNAFGLVGGDNNAVAARKRPLSSMSPTIVLKDGQPILTVGAAGGPKIITEVLWAIINHIDLEMPIGKAIAQPRLHHQWAPADLLIESTFDDKIAEGLKSRQHSIRRSSGMGICQGIAFDPETKTFTGAHDPRTTGQAIGQ